MTRWETAEERHERNSWWQQALDNPEIKSQIVETNEAVTRGELTLAQVGGITDEQLNAAYAATCKLLGTGKLDEAIQIAGYLIMISPWDARFYHLAGLCFHNKRLYDASLQYFGVALAFGDDPVILIAKGETLLMLGRRDEARQALEQGIDLAKPGDARVESHVTRSHQLLATYLGGSR
ncbi:MAG: hypothetical protein V3T05_14030 [Myxococcota bacterium]